MHLIFRLAFCWDVFFGYFKRRALNLRTGTLKKFFAEKGIGFNPNKGTNRTVCNLYVAMFARAVLGKALVSGATIIIPVGCGIC